jgi:hypothetical protein
MPNVRLLPPVAATQQTVSVNGRTYSGAPGQVLDVPDFDAGVLAANGWTRVAFSGPTASRPTANAANGPYGVAAPGMQFMDTTLGYIVVFNGAEWINPASGAAV